MSQPDLAQADDHARHAGRPRLGKGGEPRQQCGVLDVDEVAQEMHALAAIERCAQLDARHDLDAEALPACTRLRDPRHGVVIGQPQHPHTTRSGLLHQRRW